MRLDAQRRVGKLPFGQNAGIGLAGDEHGALCSEARRVELRQLGGAVVMAALGFIPGYAISYALKKADLLRVPAHAEERGLDLTEVPAQAYPEWDSMYGTSTSVGGSAPAPTSLIGESKPA